jgi:Holliday junction resolvase RusA-like endonuclease
VSRDSITIDVIGIPVAQGSMKALGRTKAGGTIITHSNGSALLPWRQEIAQAATAKWPSDWPMDAPVSISLTFRFPRPAGHFRRDGTLKPSSPQWKTTKPDLDKLCRTIGDALAGVLYRGDQQIISLIAGKRYAFNESPGVLITVVPSLTGSD